MSFTVPYIFLPSTASVPSFVKSSEVNSNFSCITQVMVDINGGHRHDGVDSRLILKSGLERISTPGGTWSVVFSESFSSALSFTVVTTALTSSTPALTTTSVLITTDPWCWSNSGFSMTAVWASDKNSAKYDGTSIPYPVQWVAVPYKP